MVRLLVPALLAVLAACTTAPSADPDARSPDTPQTDAAADAPPTPAAALLAAPMTEPLRQAETIAHRLPTTGVQAALDAAVQGLLYTSESDYPFGVFVLPGAGTPHVTAYTIKQKVAPFYVQRPQSLPLAQRAVESLTLTALFKPYVEPQDWWGDFEKARAPLFQKLKKIMTSQLSYLHVYRVGPKTPWGLSPDIDVFIVGTTVDGDVIVLWTVSIET